MALKVGQVAVGESAEVAVPSKMVAIEYMQRRIGAYDSPGVDSKASVIKEVEEMFNKGWTLFQTHYGGDSGSGIILLHVFIKYATE